MAQIAFNNIDFTYSGRGDAVFTGFTVHFDSSWRLGLVARNGRGKTTLLNLLAGTLQPGSGTIQVPAGLQPLIFPPPVDYTSPDTAVLTLLKKMGFPREAFAADITHFSAGQQRKLLLAISICTPAHLYLWDEPLNYLDIQTREQIEGVLLAASPTLVFAEHDAYFCQKIATQTIMLPK